MDSSRLEILPKVWLDYRRAIYLEEHSTVAVADLHLGYAWAHRYNGQMLPFGPGDGLVERLTELCAFYKPRQFALLGDILHQAVPVSELATDLHQLIHALGETCETKLILGNHDRRIRSILPEGSHDLLKEVRLGSFTLLHGDETPADLGEATVVMGHEHPAISLGDGIKGARFPCFLVSDTVLVLPAFSSWAAGADIRANHFMSPIARNTRFRKVVAICGKKLLPLNWG